MAESMEIDSEEALFITTTRAEDVGMEDAPANNEKEKKKKSKKKKKKNKTKDDGVTPGGPMVEATDSKNATAATQGVRVGTENNIYNTRLPDVPIEYYYSEEAKAEGLKAEAEWNLAQKATTTTINNDNNGDGHDISGVMDNVAAVLALALAVETRQHK